MNDYFEKILQAEVYEVAKKTPLEKAHNLSNKLISFKKHKLVESNVSDEANSTELASKLWILSEEICRSFGFVTFNI